MNVSYRKVAPMLVSIGATGTLALRDGWRGLALTGLVLFAIIGVILLLMSSTTTGRHRAVAAAHPDAEVIEVWGAAGLRDALRDHGVASPKVRNTQGTALSMVIDQSGVGLWRNRSQPVVKLSWAQLVGVFTGDGMVANDGPRPAAVLVTGQGASLTLCPAAKTTGSLLTAREDVVLALVERLNRQISGASTVPGSDNRLNT